MIELMTVLVVIWQQSHIDANVPSPQQFDRLLKRDLQAYLDAKAGAHLSMDYELLRNEPTQAGAAYPKYYVWVKASDSSRIVLAGAARIAAIDRERFEVTDFVSAAEINSDPAVVDRIFPAVLKAAIVAKARARASIHDVDFQNIDYAWPERGTGVPSTWRWLSSPPRSSVRSDGARLEFQSVVFGDLTGDGEDEAAVDLLYSTGGTANWHYVLVYTLAGGSPRLLGVLQSGSRADGGLIRMAIQDNALVLDFADAQRRIADCCSEGYVRVQYVWRDGQFRESGARSHGDLR